MVTQKIKNVNTINKRKYTLILTFYLHEETIVAQIVHKVSENTNFCTISLKMIKITIQNSQNNPLIFYNGFVYKKS